MLKPRPTQEHLIGKVLQGTYRVERVLGEGGTSIVYEASHLRVKGYFAIKLLLPRLARSSYALTRFRREAQIASGIGHPNILGVIDFNETQDGYPYLVLERLAGETMAERLKRSGTLSLGEGISIARQTASAVQAAHDKGVVHRDLKPSNIFLCQHTPGDTFVKVLDFGISKLLHAERSITQTDMLIGTPRYMAPEQILRPSSVDSRTDVYALGVILYECLGGRPPFDGVSMPEIIHRVVHETPEPLRLRAAHVPESIVSIIERAMHKEPARRYARIDDLARALGEAGGSIGERTASLSGSTGVEPPRDGAPEADPATDQWSAAATGSTIPIHTMTPVMAAPRPRRSRLPIALFAVLAAVVVVAVSLTGLRTKVSPPDANPGERSAALPPAAPDVSGDTAAQQDTLDAYAASQAVDARPAEPKQQHARLIWISTVPPGAVVSIDGVTLGRTPLKAVPLTVDKAVLLVRKAGFLPRRIPLAAGVESVRFPRLVLRRIRRVRGGGSSKHDAQKTSPDWIIEPKL